MPLLYTDGMPPLFSRLLGNKKSRRLLAIDIGSDSTIRSFLFKEGGGRRIALQKRSFALPRSRELSARGLASLEDGEDSIPYIGRYLHELVGACIRQAGSRPEEALVGLGGRLAQNKIEAVDVLREREDTPVREEELHVALSTFRQEHCWRAAGDKRYLLASVMPLGVTLDGQPLAALTPARRGRITRVVLFTTYVLEAYGEMLAELRSHWAGLRLTAISDQAAIAAALIGAVHSHEALLVKVGAKTTEVSIVDHESVLFAGQFPYGGDAVTLAIARQTGLDRRRSEEIKMRFKHAVLPQEATRGVSTAVQSAVANWVSALRDLLGASGITLPERVFLFGGGARLEAIRSALASKIWYHDLPSRGAISVTVLGGEAIAGSIFWNREPAIAGPDEVALAALVYRLASGK